MFGDCVIDYELVAAIFHLLVKIDMSLNARKSICMVFLPRDRSKVVSTSFLPLCIGNDCYILYEVLHIWDIRLYTAM